MSLRRIRVLIVDDSSFVRKALQRIFNSDPEMEVAGVASSGSEAVEKLLLLKPDVITLDVVMPGMDGIETLKAIMEMRPTPVLMLSQLTRQGTELTLKALELGAMDFVDKSSTGMMDFLDLAQEVLSKVRSIAGGTPVRMGSGPTRTDRAVSSGLIDIVAIGASTGGPIALQMLLSKFPEGIGFAVLIVQHMPVGFTAPLAKRIDSVCAITVKEAEEGEPVLPGVAFIAPAGLHMTVERNDHGSIIRLSEDPYEAIHRPAVDVLFSSVAEYGARSIGVILTGMGSDGAAGLRLIRENGGFTIAQDEATSAIFGMPRSAIEKGAVEKILPITAIAEEILLRA